MRCKLKGNRVHIHLYCDMAREIYMNQSTPDYLFTSYNHFFKYSKLKHR